MAGAQSSPTARSLQPSTVSLALAGIFSVSQVNCSYLQATGLTNISKERGWGCQNHASVFQRRAKTTLCSLAHKHQDESPSLLDPSFPHPDSTYINITCICRCTVQQQATQHCSDTQGHTTPQCVLTHPGDALQEVTAAVGRGIPVPPHIFQPL